MIRNIISFKIIVHQYLFIIQMKDKEKEKRGDNDSKILVAIRVRPLNSKQISIGEGDVVRTQDNLIIILDPVEMLYQMENKKILDVLHRSKEQRYAFDKIYRNQSSQLIYQQTTKSLIKTVITGKNATVFAYGPTGTGKTYTMLGNEQVYGLNVLAIRDIFSLIEVDHQYNYTVVITYVQIYNQMIRDLLIPASGYLELRDDSEKGVSIAGVTQFKAQSTEQVMELLLIGNKRRTTEATNANQTSSRSHAVFQINVIKTPRTKNTSIQTLSGKLSLIDLAGSERGTVTQNRGIRLLEGAKINRSLLALANCINALGDKNKKGFFVPYRDSKLTRLLKDSLGGNCKTVMIANISPAGSQFQETINTLKYANRAKNIKTKPLTNKKLISIHISEYKSIINELRQEIEQLKVKLQKNPLLNASEVNYDKQKVNESLIDKNENQMCNCGRLQQNQEVKKIKERIFENFNDRIQLRKVLIEIQDQNSLNFIDIRRKQNQMVALKQEQLADGDSQEKNIGEQIKILNKNIYTLKLSTQKNILKKQITNLQLVESMSITKKIKEQIPKKIKTKQNRDLLQILIKNHILELQNIELEINLQEQQKILYDLQKISVFNRETLEEGGINLEQLKKQGEELDSELEASDKDNIQLELEQQQDADNEEKDDQPNLQESIQQLNRDANRNIIQQTFEERYDDDFQQQDQQEIQKQLVPAFSDAHLELMEEKKQFKTDEDQQKFKNYKRQYRKDLSKNKRQDTKNTHINNSLGNIGTKINQELELGKKNNTGLSVGKSPQVGLELGVVGFSSVNKKREKTTGNQLGMGNGIIGNNLKIGNKMTNGGGISSGNINLKEQPVENISLDLNLKGTNVRLNQKLPFLLAPKDKKKK